MANPTPAWRIALWVARALVAIPFFMASGLEGLSSPATLAEMDLVWIPGAPLWLVRLVAAVEGLAALGLILPGIVRLPGGLITASAAVLLVVQVTALGLDLAAGNPGDLPVKTVVLALTLFILWARLRGIAMNSPSP
ncbi:DoxX family protein [Rhizobium sp. FKL33]|uniref:DoxX family protein n=1 Tax=Rhizobium sp. FKL33 TaxID=2562307 RepID=UPI0010C0CC1D|nr:DoxX family protein [Rhizobium sp. FKL33]